MGCNKEQTMVGKGWLVKQSEDSPRKSQASHSCLELITAVKLGDLDTVRGLCSQGLVGVDVTYRGATPLGLAVARGDTAMVQLLCQCGADVNKRWKDQGSIVTIIFLSHD